MSRVDPASERLVLLIKSDGYEDILLAISLAGIAASADQRVTMFFTNRAARRLKSDGWNDLDQIDAIGAMFLDGAEALGFGDLATMLLDLKATGHVHIYLCSRAARIWDIDPDSMISGVDGIMGTATFLLDEARTARTILTI